MEKSLKGDVIVIPFPFSDLSSTKKRPALVIATLQGDDVLCCQITSEERFDNYSIELRDEEFVTGALKQKSMIRPNKIFTADKSIILYKVGMIKTTKVKEIEKILTRMITS